jgi:hypothetical protein
VREIACVALLITKALLFVALGGIAAGLLWVRSPSLTTLLLLVLCVWAFARSYYFLFYVIEHYVDPAFRFSGVASALRHLWRHRAHRIAP